MTRTPSVAAATDGGFSILGWHMADGSMPLGDYDEVDPDLAQFDRPLVPNREPVIEHSTGPGARSLERVEALRLDEERPK